MALPLILFVPRTRAVAFVLTAAGLAFLAWAFTAQYLRYSLPLLLLTAVLDQDMYLAGSMIMALSFLTVIGTLISDILLLWLDPRIRYEGQSR